MRNPFKDPLFHVVRRRDIPWWKALLFRFGAIALGLLLVFLVVLIYSLTNADEALESPFMFLPELFLGNFGTARSIWVTIHDTALLLIVALALIPAFKMKFWNLGGDGQILMSALVGIMVMFFGGQAGWSDWLIILVMIPASILTGIIWAVIPAVFKAFFNTNESLFTLMMNYVATAIVGVFLSAAVSNGSGTLGLVSTGNLPQIGGSYYILTIIVAVLLLGLVYAYLRFHKHGYELEVVGESQNTAKYIGVDVKKVIIRTVILSGAICGIAGLLIAGSIDKTISETSARGMGFTAIMVAWLAHFNPFAVVGTSFLITFINNGMSQVQTSFGITNSAIASMSIGLIYFAVIAVEFLISYRVVFNRKKKPEEENKAEPVSENKEGK